jgi:hypothetical protein
MDEVSLRHILSKYFGFPCQSLSRLLHAHYLSSGAGTTCQIVVDVPSGLSLTPPQETKRSFPLCMRNPEVNAAFIAVRYWAAEFSPPKLFKIYFLSL